MISVYAKLNRAPECNMGVGYCMVVINDVYNMGAELGTVMHWEFVNVVETQVSNIGKTGWAMDL